MSKTPSEKPNKEIAKAGPVSQFLSEKGFSHQSLNPDHIGVEIIGVSPPDLIAIVSALKAAGFDYLQCQGGYDEGPGQNIVCFYHLVAIDELVKTNSSPSKNEQLREVRIKIFLPRENTPKVPSLYKLFRGADWQERETYDMFGIHFQDHPHPKRLLMPEDWKGWPLRKDYIQPDFYEMQDAY